MSEQSRPAAGAVGRPGERGGDGTLEGPDHVFGAAAQTAVDLRGPHAGHLGAFRAADGTTGAPVGIDLDAPHVALVVGKRGSGKSHTLGVLAEELATARGVAPVVVDPMGEFDGLSEGVPATVTEPAIPADGVEPRAWCSLLDLDPAGAVGGLVWRAADRAATLEAMRDLVDDCSAAAPVARAARNHLERAVSWGIFDPAGTTASARRDGHVTVLDCAGLAPPAVGATVHVLARGLYEDALADEEAPLPWLLVDEAARHATGVAAPAIRTVLTRGRTPGVSLVLATQRPGALPPVAVSQADLLVAHRLTDAADVEALERARPTYLRGSVSERLPSTPGAALVVDEATERAATVAVRERETPHGGTTPLARDRAASTGAGTGP